MEIIGRVTMRKKSGYMFTNRRHSKRAIMSTILGCISMVSLISIIYLSYLRKGAHLGSTGMTGLLITLFSMTGLILGVITMMEKERYRIFPVLGIVLNLLDLAGISLVLYAGAILV